MSKLFNSLSPPKDNIAGVGDAFQRDSLDSSHKVVFEELGHGVKFSPQSKPPALWSSWSCNTETCCLYRVWTTWFMWAAMCYQRFQELPIQSFRVGVSEQCFLARTRLLNDSVVWIICFWSNESFSHEESKDGLSFCPNWTLTLTYPRLKVNKVSQKSELPQQSSKRTSRKSNTSSRFSK